MGGADPRACPSGRGAVGWVSCHLDRGRLPRRRVLVRFEYPTLSGPGSRGWLLIERADAEICEKHPGGEEDLVVVGSGQAGCQLSEELRESGREVFLPAGGRRGCRGGHDLHYRTLQAMGVQLLGHLAGVEGHRASFAGDLADSVAFGDARHADIRKLLTEQLPTKGITAPELPDPPPFTPTRRSSWTSTGSAWRSSPPASAPTTPTGYGFLPSTPWASHSPTTVQARWSRACSSAASTSCASASPRCCSAWARMPPSWPNRSPETGHRTVPPSARTRSSGHQDGA